MQKPPSHRRFDLSDRAWSLVGFLVPGRRGQWGGIAKDNRLFLNAVFWVIRTGAPWRDLPPDYGCWSNTHRRFSRWRKSGVWDRILDSLAEAPDFEWLIIDSRHCKAHQHASGAVGGNQAMGRTKGGFNTKVHLGVDGPGMPYRIVVTEGTAAEVSHAIELIEGVEAEYLLADKAYDSDALVEYAQSNGMSAVIPPRKNRKNQHYYDKAVYKARYLV